MRDKTKAEIHITVDGPNITVQMRGGVHSMVLGTAAFIHDLAEKVQAHPEEVAGAIYQQVEALDDRMVTYDRERSTTGTEDKPC